jgi:hypothetical protein
MIRCCRSTAVCLQDDRAQKHSSVAEASEMLET